MPDSLDTTVAKAIVTALQTASDANAFSQTFTAERIYFPLFDPEKSRALRVVVVQKDYNKVISTKMKNENTLTAHIVVAKPLGQLDPTSAAATTAIDELRYFTEELISFLIRHYLGDGIGSIISAHIGDGQIFDAAALVNNHIYLAPIEVTVILTA